MKLTGFLKLVKLITLQGRFRHSGYDYAQTRKQFLADMGPFCPPPANGSRLLKWTPANPYLKAWFVQAAFIKNAMRAKGGHLWVPDLQLACIRIPKAASTALSFMMLKARYPDLKTLPLLPEKINYLADENLQAHSIPEISQTKFFAVVRDPFSRIVSVYRAFFENPQPHFLYEDYLFGVMRKDFSFLEFLRVLELIPDRLKDQHLKPQSAILDFYRQKKIDVKTLKLEEPGNIRRFLSAYDLDFDIRNKSETEYDYRQYYDKEAAEIVHRIYARDIHIFGYGSQYGRQF